MEADTEPDIVDDFVGIFVVDKVLYGSTAGFAEFTRANLDDVR